MDPLLPKATRASWTLCFGIASLWLLGGLWGFYSHDCKSIFSAAMWTLFVGTFLTFYYPAALLPVAPILAGLAWTVRAASANTWVAGKLLRLAFFTFVLFTVSGYGYAVVIDRIPTCGQIKM